MEDPSITDWEFVKALYNTIILLNPFSLLICVPEQFCEANELRGMIYTY